MKRLIFPALAVLMAVSGPALAQRDDNHRRGDRGQQTQQAPAPQAQERTQSRGNWRGQNFAQNDQNGRGRGRGNGGQNAAPAAAPAPAPAAPANNPPRTLRDFSIQQGVNVPPPSSAAQAQQDRRANGGNAPTYNNGSSRSNFDRNSAQNNNRGRNDNNRGNNNNYRNDHRNDRNWAQARNLRNYQRAFNAPRRFHAPRYSWPRGFSYIRFGWGDFLPNAFWAPSYRIYDWGAYGLEYPPPGFDWVRYGPDALLIDQFTGEIVEVEYNIFY